MNAQNRDYKLSTKEGSLQTCPMGEKPLDPQSVEKEINDFLLSPAYIFSRSVSKISDKIFDGYIHI
jgi:hypothetical protein